MKKTRVYKGITFELGTTLRESEIEAAMRDVHDEPWYLCGRGYHSFTALDTFMDVLLRDFVPAYRIDRVSLNPFLWAHIVDRPE